MSDPDNHLNNIHIDYNLLYMLWLECSK